MKNYLIISGSGKKVGKTFLGQALIKQFSAHTPIIALKISPHRHDQLGEVTLVSEQAGYRLFREWEGHQKNSGRFLEAGAIASYFLETEDVALPDAIDFFSAHCNTHNLPVVCETGALGLLIKPGVFIFIADDQSPFDPHKDAVRQLSGIVLPARVYSLPEVLKKIVLRDGRWCLERNETTH